MQPVGRSPDYNYKKYWSTLWNFLEVSVSVMKTFDIGKLCIFFLGGGGYILPYTLFRFKTTLTILIIWEVLQKNYFKAKSLITLLVFMHACFCLDNVLFNEVCPCGLMQLKQLN